MYVTSHLALVQILPAGRASEAWRAGADARTGAEATVVTAFLTDGCMETGHSIFSAQFYKKVACLRSHCHPLPW